MKSFRSRTAFTLIELLTVIAIIAIIASILFPVLTAAQERGKLAKCLSCVRQWGTATTLYLSDSGGVFPEKGAGSGGVPDNNQMKNNRLAWYNVLPPYIGMLPISNMWRTAQMPRPLRKSLFICPSAKPELTIAESDNYTFYSSYAQNYWIDSTERGSSGFGRVLRLSQIKTPAVVPIMAENSTGVVGSQPGYKLAHTHAYFMGSPDSGDAFRHNGQANIVFADGHAASFKKDAIYDSSVTSPDVNYGDIQWKPE